MNKKGLEMTVSTLITIILAVIVLALLFLVLTGQFQKFLDTIKGYNQSDLDRINNACQAQCVMGSKDSFCCQNKTLGKLTITCLDNKIKITCPMNCAGICE